MYDPYPAAAIADMPTSTGSRLVFVGGAPRSGTTLVQNILDCHPEVCGGPEFQHLPDIIELRKKLRDSLNKGWIDDFCSSGDIDRLLGNLIDSFLLPLADRYSCRYLSEKTPANVLVFPELLRLFPEARFIHVVRDPRAVVSSLMDVGKRAKNKLGRKPSTAHITDIAASIELVRRSLMAGFQAAATAPDRVCTVVYERLVASPEEETRKLCALLGLSWSEKMLHPGEIEHLGEKAIVNNIWYDRRSYYRDPVPNEIDKWKKRLRPSHRVMVTSAFSKMPELLKLGYDFSMADLPSWSRSTAMLTASAYRLRTVGSSFASRVLARFVSSNSSAPQKAWDS